MPMHVLERTQVVPRPRAEVFAFFSAAENLAKMSPPSLRFSIKTRLPIEMKAGTLIDYQIRLFGIPFPWRTRIELFDPIDSFVDVQLRGPYKTWRHTHRFEDAPGGTRVSDHVEYELPLGPLGTIAHLVFVQRQLDFIFSYRAKVMKEMFG